MSTPDGVLNPLSAAPTTGNALTSIPQSNTPPSSPRRSIKTSLNSTRSSPNTSPTSEQNHQRRLERRRQKSLASSSENSTKTPGNGPGSKPSSRRPSCTIVNPSRPARHYRVASSPSVPTASCDIDDAIALHFRSCSLFQNVPPQTTSPDRTILHHQHAPVKSPPKQMETSPALTILNNANKPDALVAELPANGSDEVVVVPPQNHNVTMHWLSPESRREQYERMDKANTGLRCFVRKVVPKSISGTPPPRFFDDDHSDVGSVRRYRMDLPHDEQITIDDKPASLPQRPPKKTGADIKPTGCGTQMKRTRRWFCL